MNPDNYSPELIALIAKNILLSHGGSIYPIPGTLVVNVLEADGVTEKSRDITSIHFTPGEKYGGCYLGFIGGDARVTGTEDTLRIYRYIVSRFDFPDKDILIEDAPLRSRLALRERNMSFISLHGDFTQSDYEMIESYQKFFSERMRKMEGQPVPSAGDIVEGAYYNGACPFRNGVIESHPAWKKPLSICAGPYVPFITFADKEETRLTMSVSGGPFFGLDTDDLEYVGPDERLLCDWGHCGPTAGGSIDFPVMVNRWKVKDGVDY